MLVPPKRISKGKPGRLNDLLARFLMELFPAPTWPSQN